LFPRKLSTFRDNVSRREFISRSAFIDPWPLLRAVKNTQQPDCIANGINHDERRPGYDQLTRSFRSPFTTGIWKRRQPLDLTFDLIPHWERSGRRFCRNMPSYVVEILAIAFFADKPHWLFALFSDPA
jgi:hypothetical protein